ncbi:uncharacterized protein LOC107624461 isoform X2 [Arachis ipaensis]|uniref:amino acid transporter AVT1A-like n=1 Tax=Arachis hypogaea TaxID=3818 RepID=UPI0007AEECC9|nr:uncharacterized protein LOC107624461 isoform X2 [Arachis ipaensis]XP_025683866.1 amino acid transporter AVT1A-like [Arachis hypogaea]XP_025683872.1 amino acid transporter AVT1A-like [Arachis hypogaea]XP_029152539.1 amino acid transporter AVT1A-like [Arachis hypogaea]XP_029152540.1 amino acid transporter AVT1A-like [Arachis hypogaea]
MPKLKSWLFSTGLKLLIHAIVMDTTCITIMKNGVKRILVNHSSIGLFPGSSLDIGSLHLDSKQLSQITLNLPANAFASKIILWIIVLSPFTKYALTTNPLARSLEELLPHRISSTTWCFMPLRTILVMATLLTAFLIPYFDEGQKGSCCYACKIKRKCKDRRY